MCIEVKRGVKLLKENGIQKFIEYWKVLLID